MNPRVLIGIVLFLVVGSVAILNPEGNFWGPVEPPKAQCEAYNDDRLQRATVLNAEIYDQAKLDRFFREPQNTFSNLAYIFAGLWVFAFRQIIARSVSLCLMFLGFGSGMYHASLLPEWRLIDILGVYSVLSTLFILAVYKLKKSSISRPAQLYICLATVTIAFAAGIYRNSFRISGVKIFDSTYIVVGFVAAIFGLFTLYVFRSRELPLSMRIVNWTMVSASTMLCIIGGLGDRFGGFLANPNSMIQGHTVWHTFGALSAALTTRIFCASHDSQ